jgi:hypothetical protein
MNVAASNGHGKLYAACYSVSPCGIFVPADSQVKTPADLAGVPISVGYQSGSHYATIQGLEQYLKPEEIELSFRDGLLFSRMELLIDGKVPAASLFSGPYYFVEQVGFRKIIDTTFMMASIVNGTPDPQDVRKYFSALRRAQRDIDLRPELYTHYYKRNFRAASAIEWIPGAGAPVSGWSSSPTRKRHSRSRLPGSSSTVFSRAAKWAAANTRPRSLHKGTGAAAFEPGLSVGRFPAGDCVLAGIEMRAHLGEHVAEHLRREHAGVRIVARAMIAIEQHDLAHRPHAAMAEWMIGAPRRARPHHCLVRDPAERDDRAKLRHFRDGFAEEITAGGDFFRCWLVLGRHAANGVGDAAIDQGKAVIGPRLIGALCKTKVRQRLVEKIAGIISRKGPPGAIGAA